MTNGGEFMVQRGPNEKLSWVIRCQKPNICFTSKVLKKN